MEPLRKVSSRAAYLPEENIDTDVIFPARYLLLMERDGLQEYLFRDRRFTADGHAKPGFILDDPEFADVRILIAGDGFGCGSSREQAVWALAGAGICCVIAPSFGDIFASNCLKNGVLPLPLDATLVNDLGERARNRAVFDLDIETLTLSVDDAHVADIELPEAQRQALLNGWDETDLLLRDESAAIEAFEQRHRRAQPWLFVGPQ